jgi:hypothetical protein
MSEIHPYPYLNTRLPPIWFMELGRLEAGWVSCIEVKSKILPGASRPHDSAQLRIPSALPLSTVCYSGSLSHG